MILKTGMIMLNYELAGVAKKTCGAVLVLSPMAIRELCLLRRAVTGKMYSYIKVTCGDTVQMSKKNIFIPLFLGLTVKFSFQIKHFLIFPCLDYSEYQQLFLCLRNNLTTRS